MVFAMKNCYKPTVMILPEDEYFPHQNLINEMQPELTIVADTESLLSKINTATTINDHGDDDEDSDNDLLESDGVHDNQLNSKKPPGKIVIPHPPCN